METPTIQRVTRYLWDKFELTCDPIEDTIKCKKTKTGYQVKYLSPDLLGESPREWDNLGTLVCFHSRYDLGDKTDYNAETFNSFNDLEKTIRKDHNIAVIMPVFLYDHSGLSVSVSRTYPFNCRWDAGQVGFIYVSKETLLKEYTTKIVSKEIIEKATSVLEGEIKTLDQYLTNDVYMLVEDRFDKDKRGIDSDYLGGLYGYQYAIGELENSI